MQKKEYSAMSFRKNHDLFICCFLFCVFAIFSLRLFLFYQFASEISVYEGIARACVGFLIDCLPLFALCGLLLLFKNKIFLILLICYAIIIILYDGINCILAYNTKDILNYDILTQIVTTVPELKSIYTVITVPNTLYLLAVLLAIAVFFYLFYISFNKRKNYGKKYGIMLGLLCLISLATAFLQAYGTAATPANREAAISKPIHANLRDIFTDGEEAPPASVVIPPKGALSEEDKRKLASLGMLRQMPPPGGPYKNIVLVAVESLDLAYLHAYNPAIPAEASRNLDAIASKFVSFRNFFTSAQPTTFGLHALLSSRLDVFADMVGDNVVPNLFTEMQQHGYAAYFLGAMNGQYVTWSAKDAGWKRTAERNYGAAHAMFAADFEKKYQKKSSGWGMDSAVLFAEAESLLRHARPGTGNFIFIYTIDTHPPYGGRPPEGDACLRDERIAASPFLLSLCALDRKLGAFVQAVQPYLDDTLILITADHSATHGENYTRRSRFTPDRIPLLWISRREPAGFAANGQQMDNYCAQIDLPVTLLNLSGLPVPATFMGNDLRVKNAACSLLAQKTIRLLTPQAECLVDRRDASSALARWFRLYYPR